LVDDALDSCSGIHDISACLTFHIQYFIYIKNDVFGDISLDQKESERSDSDFFCRGIESFFAFFRIPFSGFKICFLVQHLKHLIKRDCPSFSGGEW